MEYGKVWHPGDCLNSSKGSDLHIVGEYVNHTHPYTTTKAVNTNDPDYDPIDTIMSRLYDYRQYSGKSLVNLSCDCEMANQIIVQKQQRKKYDSSDESDSSESDDDEDLQLCVLIKMLKGLQDKVPSSSSNKAFLSIVDTFSCHENIQEKDFEEIWNILQTNNVMVMELTLKLICHLCVKGDNTELFLNQGLLNLIQSKLLFSQYTQIHTAALFVLEAVITHYSLKYRWIDHMTQAFIQSLLRNLSGDRPVDYKYAACCFFRTLSQYEEFFSLISDEVIPVMQTVVDTYSDKLKVVFLEILHKIVMYQEKISPDFIDECILPITVDVIRDGPCGPQSKALQLLVILTKTDVGVSATLNNSVVLIFTLCCINEAKCRSVRVAAMEVIGNVTGTRRLGLCKEIMAQIAGYIGQQMSKDQEMKSPRGQSRLEVVSPRANSVLSRSEVRSPGGNSTFPVSEVITSRNNPALQRPISSMSYYEKEGFLWKGLEQMITNLSSIFSREEKQDCCGLVEKNDKGEVIHMGYKPCLDASHTRVGILKHTITVLQNICMWPASKSRHDLSRIDLNNFTDNQKYRLKLSKVNRYFTQLVWDQVGTYVVDLLHKFSQELKNILQFVDDSENSTSDIIEEEVEDSESNNTNDKTITIKGQNVSHDLVRSFINNKGQIDLYSVFEEEEIILIRTLLEFLLCISLCSCKGFPNLLPKEEIVSHDKSLSGNRTGRITQSDSAITRPRPSSAKVITRPASAIDRPPSAKGGNHEGLWVKENPHLTPRFNRFSAVPEKKEHLQDHHADLLEKEMNTERRLLRKCLYESGIIPCVASFINCTDKDCQILTLNILRCIIQPLQERVVSRTEVSSQNKTLIRPKSAMTSADIQEVEKRLNAALNDMSPELSKIIKDALGPRSEPMLELNNSLNISQFQKKNTAADNRAKKKYRPKLNSNRPIAEQCRERLLLDCSGSLLSGIFNSSPDCRKQSLLIIQDLVYFGEPSIHKKLSELGCMKKLLDFLRVNTSDELLEVTGLIIVQMLLVTDHRLKSVFDRYGGTRLLTSMVQYTSGQLKQEATKTLQTLTKVSDLPKKRIRPKSAPVGRSITSATIAAPDIWDQIQQRWKMEDRVTEVLQQWSK